jgi:hypothetical protein
MWDFRKCFKLKNNITDIVIISLDIRITKIIEKVLGKSKIIKNFRINTWII